MTEKHTHSEKNDKNGAQAHSAPADAQTPFFLYQQTWNTEAKKALEETSRALEKGFSEYEKNMSEMNRMFVAQSRFVMEQQKAFLDAMMVGARALVK